MAAQIIIDPEGLVAQCRNDSVMLQLEAGERTGDRSLTHCSDELRLVHVGFDISSAIRLQESTRHFVRILLSRGMLPPLVMSQMTPYQCE